MSRHLLLSAIIIIASISCGKHIEDHLTGEWKVDVACKKGIVRSRLFLKGL